MRRMMAMGSEKVSGRLQERIYAISLRLRKAYEEGKLTQDQIARLEAIGFKWKWGYQTPLSESHPELVEQWHPTKNGDLTPHDVTAGSGKKVWWRCPDCGGEWEASVCNRARRGHERGQGCPYCNGKKVLVGFNDLATKRPDIADEWHPTKNGDLTPQDVTAGSRKEVWWKCPDCGGEWERSVREQVKQDGKCPYCNGRKVLPGFNDLETTHPKLAKQWHPTKNGSLTPRDIVAGSEKKVWWRCPDCGGEWETKVSHRVRGSECPYCNNTKVLIGYNDLKTVKPDIAAQWHPTKNGDLTPQDVTAGSSKTKVWWRHWHEESQTWHEWERSVNEEQRYKGRCPYCNGKKVLVGFNDLATKRPDIADEWHPTKNGDLTPQDVTAGSSRKVWWKCPTCDDEWRATIAARTNRNNPTGCPKCGSDRSGRKRRKPVVCIETGEVFGGVAEATKACGGKNATPIIYCIKGKNKTSYGYHWRYATEEEIAAHQAKEAQDGQGKE